MPAGDLRLTGRGYRLQSHIAPRYAAGLHRPEVPSSRPGPRRTFPRVAPADGALDAGVRGISDQPAKPRVAIDLEKTTEPFQVSGGVLALPVFAVNTSGGGVTDTTPGPIVDRVAPQPAGLRLSLARIEHRQRRVIGEHLGRGQNRAQDPLVQRRQPPAGATDPVAQCGMIQRHALTGEDLGLTVQR